MENTVKLTLYFSDNQAVDLLPERREVLRKNEPLEVIVLRELIKGPLGLDKQRTLPPETKVISVEVVDRVAYANFSREIVTRHPGGSTGEYMTIMSIVYSLTELPGIEKVQLLVEGEKKEAMFGHGTTIDPIGRPTTQLFTTNVVDPLIAEQAPWATESPSLSGEVTAVGVGRITGAAVDIFAFVEDELYVFSREETGYKLRISIPLDRHITSIATADITGDGKEELILAGAVSGSLSPNVPGFIAVYSWSDEALIKLTDMSKNTMPFWGVATLDITGDGRAEIVASNGAAMLIYEWKNDGLEQVHAVTRFSGAVSSARIADRDYLAWRDANGTSVGVFYWNFVEWGTVFRADGVGEWTDSIPTCGELSEDGSIELAVLGLDGSLNVFNQDGVRITINDEWQEAFVTAPPSSSPVIAKVLGESYLVFGTGDKIQVLPWK